MKFIQRLWWLGLVLLITPVWVMGQSQIPDSRGKITRTEWYSSVQLIRCDNSDSLTAGPTWVQGEVCAAGDYSKPFDARGYNNVCVMYHEYGTGTGEAFLWSCMESEGAGGGWIATLLGLASEPPANSPSSADPEPLCIELTDVILGATALDGTATQEACIGDYPLGWLIGEIQGCTGNCDATLSVRVSR